MVGRILGNRYELLELVGTGGMAFVYKAHCKLLNRFVAVKLLKDEFLTDEDFLKKFETESQAAASLSHPNIVNIYDVGMEDGLPYIVMEYVEGPTLKEYIDAHDGFLDNMEIANFSKQIALALEHAHNNKIIHRDIKPHNILVTKDKVLKVADFGIASPITEATIAVDKEAIGSVRYISPEQLRGYKVDMRSDLYSLGVLMYELSTKKVPFEGDKTIEIAVKHMNEKITPPDEINSTIHKGIQSIIFKSLEKHQDKRYQTAGELIDDLDKILNHSKDSLPLYHSTDNDDDGKTMKIPFVNDKIKTIKKEKKEENKKEEKNIFAIIGVVILAFITVLFIFILSRTIPSSSNNNIELSSYVNMPLEEARQKLIANGYEVLLGEGEKSSNIKKGYIISQSPQPGTKVRKGAKITLFPSLGIGKDLVPNLLQTNYKDVEFKLENTKFEIGDVKKENNDLTKGFIISQSPEPGAEVYEDTKIDLVVSLGPEKTTVLLPLLKDKTLLEAEKLLDEINIEIGKVDYKQSDTVEKDKIISQSIEASTEVEEGSLVDVVISLGKEESKDPDPVNNTSTKTYNVPTTSYKGQDIKIKVLFDAGGKPKIIFSNDYTITEDMDSVRISVTASGKGNISFFINDTLITSTTADFGN